MGLSRTISETQAISDENAHYRTNVYLVHPLRGYPTQWWIYQMVEKVWGFV